MKKLSASVLILLALSGLFSSSNAQVNYSLVCVDSVWYDTNPQFINVRIYNGDTTHMNYPSVQIISPTNDTVGNPSNFVNFFAQLQFTYQTYTDTITQPGILDFSGYTFLMNEGFGSSTGVISWCGPVAVEKLFENEIKIFPNPVTEQFLITNTAAGTDALKIYDATGNMVLDQYLKRNNNELITLDISNFKSGIYFIRLTNNTNVSGAKFIKQ